MENLISQHGPIGAMALTMLITGNLVNLNATLTSVSPTLCNSSNMNFTAKLPNGLEETVLALSVLVPIVPFILNKPNDINVEMFKSHVLGQSSSFGLSEVIRHFTVMPEQTFLQKCNISHSECIKKSELSNITILSNVKQNSLCNRNFTSSDTIDLFNSIHHFPNHTCVMLGSSLVTVICTILFWQRLSDKKISPYQNHSCTKLFFILVQTVIVFIIIYYCFILYKSLDSIQFIGFLLGVILQSCITLSLMKN